MAELSLVPRRTRPRDENAGERGDETCGICFEPVEVRGRIACEHLFCIDCIQQAALIKQECPICRRRFTTIHSVDLFAAGSSVSRPALPVAPAWRGGRPETYSNIITRSKDRPAANQALFLRLMAEPQLRADDPRIEQLRPHERVALQRARAAVLARSTTSTQTLAVVPAASDDRVLVSASTGTAVNSVESEPDSAVTPTVSTTRSRTMVVMTRSRANAQRMEGTITSTTTTSTRFVINLTDEFYVDLPQADE